MQYVRIRGRLKANEKTVLVIGIVLLFIELSFIPAQICEYDQSTKQQICTISNTASEIVWHILKFLNDNSPAITAIATAAVAYFTYILWEATHGLKTLAIKQASDMKDSLTIAKDTASAAKESAEATKEYVEAFIDSKRPHIGISQTLGWVENNSRPSASVIFRNMGESIAFIDFTKVEFYYGNGLKKPRIFKYTTARKQHQRIIRHNEFIEHKMAHERAFTAEEVAALKRGEKYLFIFGYIIFHDSFENRRERGFGVKIDYSKGSYAKSGGDAYNYNTCTREEDT